MPVTTTSFVQPFDVGHAEDADLLGGKGANLAEMTRLGLPVPPGFTVTTEACRRYHAEGAGLPAGLAEQIAASVADLEHRTGRRLGGSERPLLLSVRSGARFSMPGMMDTVLDLGLNDDTVAALAAESGDPRFAWDAYRRFVQMYASVVLEIPKADLDAVVQRTVAAVGGVAEDVAATGWREVVADLKVLVADRTGRPFPVDPVEQLLGAVEAVLRSWNGRRARDYRRMEGIPDDIGTAVNVQAMVFGNLGARSGTGVVFTRNPSTGAPEPYGDWLQGAQGEDVVSGVRLTRPVAELEEAFPDCARELVAVLAQLEQRYRDMCDVEFTIEDGRLFVLQTRVGKRTAAAAVRMAVDMVAEGLIGRDDALRRVTTEQVERLLHPQFDPGASYEVLAHGLAASPGAATGEVCLSADLAEALAAEGRHVILVRPETSPDDLHGMIAAQGILTSRGGLVSHAAVVARGMGKPAVCGAEAVHIDLDAGTVTVGSTVIRVGDVISIDGGTGELVLGPVPVVVPATDPAVAVLLDWADDVRRLGVRANADLPADARVARELGAEGIGLCRTEHMFLGDRLPVVQRVILAADEDEREVALAELGALQRGDFAGLLEVMHDLPVTVRLLDPPLHEFLPHLAELRAAEVRGELDERGHVLLEAAEHWREDNPMLGTRGCRLGILMPGLYRMQVRALAQAAVDVARAGGRPRVEVMVPLVSHVRELEVVAGWVQEEVATVVGDADVVITVGTMVETPRAALIAGDLARSATFMSFGTNDLTQMTYGFSRDDVESRIMPLYEQLGIMGDPFAVLDDVGVGRLIRVAVAEAKAVRPGVTLGVCGEHGGDPASIALCDRMGLDYVSCSPLRLPVARLAAAQATLGGGRADGTR
jgi:pyruvate,orthophosphate dikinase